MVSDIRNKPSPGAGLKKKNENAVANSILTDFILNTLLRIVLLKYIERILRFGDLIPFALKLCPVQIVVGVVAAGIIHISISFLPIRSITRRSGSFMYS